MACEKWGLRQRRPVLAAFQVFDRQHRRGTFGRGFDGTPPSDPGLFKQTGEATLHVLLLVGLGLVIELVKHDNRARIQRLELHVMDQLKGKLGYYVL